MIATLCSIVWSLVASNINVGAGTCVSACPAAIALAKENDGLTDGLCHSLLKGCGVPNPGAAETVHVA